MFRSKALRPIAGLVLVTFSALTLQPLTAAAQLASAHSRAQTSSNSDEERFSRTLNEIHEILKEVVPQAAMPHRPKAAAPTAPGKPGEKVLQAVGPKMRLESESAKPVPGVDVAAKVKALRGKYKELKSLEAEVNKGFKETEKHIRDKNLPPEILARHEQAVAEYEKRKTEFGTLMQAVETAADGKGELQSALSNLGDFMAKYPNAKTHTPTDPNNLPWGPSKPVTRAPYTSPAQFKTSRLFGETVKVAQAGSISGISLPSTVLPATPMPADTAPTEDVQITQAIRDLATSLGNNPVKIYNWVRNNIQFVPSYGSIQGSDMTLQTKRGNSFDTASLLIALLRSAGVPSRYVYGTIEVPADRAMNWVGGVTVPQAAQSLMGQGGIPNIGGGFAGQIRSIRLEHVWVEAFVDYVPSRGAVNRNPNTWVPLDASFKQYRYTQGMDLRTNVPVNVNNFVAQAGQGATINEAEGWVQNPNQALAQQAIANYQAQVTNYVNAQNPNATLGDVSGTRAIIQESRPILLGTLPYTRIATGAKFQVIPDNLRWKFRYSMYANDTDRADANPFIDYTQSTASLAGKKITQSFSAATQADQDTLDSFIPPSGPLPISFPGYLIHLVPELRVEGQLVATGPAFTMGSELIQGAAYFNPASGQLESAEDNRPIVGQYIATVLDLQGISQSQITALTTRLGDTKAKVNQFLQNPGDPTPIQTLTKEAIAGDLLYSAVLSYFVAIDTTGSNTARGAGVVTQRMPSFGNFGTASQVLFFFGIQKSVGFPGVQMDVDRVIGSEVALDATPGAVIAFRRAVGVQGSALEHLIPEQAFKNSRLAADDPLQPQGVSAVKAIAIAASQGQRIYTLNAANQAIHAATISQLGIDPDARQEITDALASGKEVTVHRSTISYAGFTGSGYIIVDPQTGAGAYRISGGLNGALELLIAGLKGALPYISALLSLSKMLGPFAIIPDLIDTALTLHDALEHCPPPLGAWIAGFAVAFFVVTTLLAIALGGLALGPGGVALVGIILALINAALSHQLDAMRRRWCTL